MYIYIYIYITYIYLRASRPSRAQTPCSFRTSVCRSWTLFLSIHTSCYVIPVIYNTDDYQFILVFCRIYFISWMSFLLLVPRGSWRSAFGAGGGTGSGSLPSSSVLCLSRLTHIYMYIYIYICFCLCRSCMNNNTYYNNIAFVIIHTV